jgi:fluoride ion exporter CrcB/FEX
MIAMFRKAKPSPDQRFQALDMLTTARIVPAIAYIVSTNLLGLAAVWVGLRAFR